MMKKVFVQSRWTLFWFHNEEWFSRKINSCIYENSFFTQCEILFLHDKEWFFHMMKIDILHNENIFLHDEKYFYSECKIKNTLFRQWKYFLIRFKIIFYTMKNISTLWWRIFSLHHKIKFFIHHENNFSPWRKSFSI